MSAARIRTACEREFGYFSKELLFPNLGHGRVNSTGKQVKYYLPVTVYPTRGQTDKIVEKTREKYVFQGQKSQASNVKMGK
jgi:hypothetical protein